MSTVTKETFWTQIVEDPTLYGTITTEDNLFNYRSDAVWQVMNETFIANGTDFEVTKWEELLELNVTETTLNGRKAAILNHITENLPITIGILEQLIKELTDDDYELEYNETENKLTLAFHEVFENEVFENEVKKITARLIPIIPNIMYYFYLPIGYTRVDWLEVTRESSQCISTDMTDVWGYKISFEVWGKDLLAIGGVTSYDTEGNNFSRNLRVYSQYDTPLMQFFISRQVNCYQEWGWANKKRTFVYNDADYSVFRDGVQMYAAAYDQGFVYQQCDNGFCLLGGKNWRNNSIDSTIGVRQGLWKFWNPEGELKGHYVPALDNTGTPCMFDTVTRKPFYNSGSGQFTVGMTVTQAYEISKLPVTGGTLTISLPSNYTDDAGVISALETARSNGWTLTIQTYTTEESTSTASTFGMQRIWVRKTQDEDGSYEDTNGNRFQVEWCVEIYSPENKTPEDLGYEQFRSVESAVEYWELTPYVYPTLEEQFNITNEEQ